MVAEQPWALDLMSFGLARRSVSRSAVQRFNYGGGGQEDEWAPTGEVGGHKTTPTSRLRVERAGWLRLLSLTFSLLIVLVQRFKERDKRRCVSGCECNVLQLSCSVAQRSCASLYRDSAIEPDDIVQGAELAIVHVWRRMAQVAETGSLESGDGSIQQDGIC